MNGYNQEYIQDIDISTILPNLKVDDKDTLFGALAREAAKISGGNGQNLQRYLKKQEEQYNSALGEHIAIPNLQVKNLSMPVTILANLDKGILYDAPDGLPVDLVCLVLSPERQGPIHLRRLSRLSRLLKTPELHAKIRETRDAETIRMLLRNPDGWMLAA